MAQQQGSGVRQGCRNALDFVMTIWSTLFPVFVVAGMTIMTIVRKTPPGETYAGYQLLLGDLCFGSLPFDLWAITLSQRGIRLVEGEGPAAKWQYGVSGALLVIHIVGAFVGPEISALIISTTQTVVYIPVASVGVTIVLMCLILLIVRIL